MELLVFDEARDVEGTDDAAITITIHDADIFL